MYTPTQWKAKQGKAQVDYKSFLGVGEESVSLDMEYIRIDQIQVLLALKIGRSVGYRYNRIISKPQIRASSKNEHLITRLPWEIWKTTKMVTTVVPTLVFLRNIRRYWWNFWAYFQYLKNPRRKGLYKLTKMLNFFDFDWNSIKSVC